MTIDTFLRAGALFALSALGATASQVSGQSVPASSVIANRTIFFNNYCGKPVHFMATSGSAPFSKPYASSCVTDSDCVLGSTCWAWRGTPLCFWDVPTPSTGSFRVDPGVQNSLVFPVVRNGLDVAWSGNIATCLDGTCSGTTETCDKYGCSVSGPVTMAELTMSRSGTDFYDVSIINGINMPMSLAPNVPAGLNLNPSDPYFCGSAGAAVPTTATGDSTWKFTPPDPAYRWVQAGGEACSYDANCTHSAAGPICGLSAADGRWPRFQRSCGTLRGYWTADQVCGMDGSVGAPFHCNQALQNPKSQPGLTLWNLMACAGAGVDSCYQNNADTACCGCADWNLIDGVEVSAFTQQCNNRNPEWMQYILPQLQWMKAACPTCYTYPYDDMSSTFVCSAANPAIGQMNLMDYNIDLCPQNKPVTLTAAQAKSINATIDTSVFRATVRANPTGGVLLEFAPHVGAADWVVLNYLEQRAADQSQAVQKSLQMSYSASTQAWQAAIPTLLAGSAVQYSFSYVLQQTSSDTFAFDVPAAAVPTVQTGAAPAGGGNGGGGGNSGPVHDFDATFTSQNNGANGVTISFQPAASTADWVILHFNIDGGNDQNVQMSKSTASIGSTAFDFNVNANFHNGTTINYFFTYQLTGRGALDSAHGAFIFRPAVPAPPATVPSTLTGDGSSVPVTPAPAPTTPSSTAHQPTTTPVTAAPVDTSSSTTNTGTPSNAVAVSDFVNSVTVLGSSAIVLFAPKTGIDWVIVHVTSDSNQQTNVGMGASSGGAFSYTINDYDGGHLTYYFTYWATGYGAKDSTTFGFDPLHGAQALNAHVTAGAAEESSSGIAPGTIAWITALAASVALASAGGAGYLYWRKQQGNRRKTAHAMSANNGAMMSGGVHSAPGVRLSAYEPETPNTQPLNPDGGVTDTEASSPSPRDGDVHDVVLGPIRRNSVNV